MDMIKSFEVDDSGVFGDLLSQRALRKEFKVGLITCGYFEYWRMYPESLQKNVLKDMTKIYNNLKAKFENVVWPEMVDTLDSAERAGKILEDERVDLVVYVAGTYCPDYMSIQAISHLKDVPMIVFNTQEHKNVDLKSSYEDTLRNSGLISTVQLMGAFRKMGWCKDIKIVIGTHDEQEVYDEIKRYANALETYKYLKELNIGLVGHVFRGMYDFEYDKTKIKGTLGPNVINIQVDHFLKEFNNTSEQEVMELLEDVKSRFDLEGVENDDIYRSSKFYFALKNIIERFRMDAICVLGQHFTEQKTGATAFLAHMLLQEEGKYVVNTEGDIHGLIMMCIMKKLTGNVPLFTEWGEYDEDNNAILMMHHGYADPKSAKSYGDIRITRAPEQWGIEGKGLGVQFTTKPGTVTLAHLIIDTDGYKMLISKGEAIELPENIPCDEITTMVRVEKPVKQFLKELIKEGFAHHAIIGYGDMVEELSLIADFMKIRKFII